jgi:arsenate reductase (thioredoxin)
MFNCIELEKTMVGAVEGKHHMTNTAGSPNVVPSVLFVCIHNAGRSQMAAGWLRHLAGNRVNIYSGGSEPAQHVNPAAVAAMEELGIDISQETPKLFTTDTVKAADVVITMGCGDTCPIFPGKKYEDWPLEDPAGQGVDAVRPIRDDIGLRVKNLLTELGIEFS